MESQQMEEAGNMGNIGEVGEVGFKRPPVHSRFRKGCSGNPNGRTKGTKNLRTDLSEVLQERITVPMGDRKVRISKQRALVMALYAKSVKGDSRSITILVNLMLRVPGFADAVDKIEQPLDEDEQELWAVIEASRQPKAVSSTTSTEPPDSSGSRS
jgi:hypothetical protein